MSAYDKFRLNFYSLVGRWAEKVSDWAVRGANRIKAKHWPEMPLFDRQNTRH